MLHASSRFASTRMVLPLATVALAGTLFSAFGCNGNSSYKSPQNLPTASMKVGSVQYTLEIVKNEENRRRGLMFRDSMPANWGMIFVFAEADNDGGFWMKNTRIPLDIIYIDGAGKVVSTHQMKPHDETSTFPAGPYKYAIELNAGQVARNGIKAGDVLSIPTDAKETTE